MRRSWIILAAVAVVAVLIVGILQTSGTDDDTAPSAAAPDLTALRGAPAPLAAVHRQANELLPADDLAARIEQLKGYPIVINIWGSWCSPCRQEFPIFQRVATQHGREIAFLGLNAGDARPAAEGFLAERPLPYPSYEDEEEDIAQDLRAARYFPMTVFVKPSGDIAFVKAGEYRSDADLEAEIDRYLCA